MEHVSAPGGLEIVSDNATETPIRVFLLLENRLLRDVLARRFRKRADLLVVGCDKRAECSPQRLLETQCDLLVLDFFDAEWLPVNLRIQTGNFSALRSLLIGMNGDSEQFVAAVRGGVTGYLLKDASASEVITALCTISRGEAVCPPKLCASLFKHVSQFPACGSVQSLSGRPDLTLRQQHLIALVAKGLTNKEIASHLNLSQYTVKNHLHRIMRQVDARSRSQAVETILSHDYSPQRRKTGVAASSGEIALTAAK